VAWPESSLPVDSCGEVDVLLLFDVDEPESLDVPVVVLLLLLLLVCSAACAAIPMPIEPASPAAISEAVSTVVRRRPWSRFIRRLRIGRRLRVG
jgi:hypothetical protein